MTDDKNRIEVLQARLRGALASENARWGELEQLRAEALGARLEIFASANVETSRINAELEPQLMAASAAWEASGCAEGTPEHIAYARAQSWLAWACESLYFETTLQSLAALKRIA